IEPGGAGRPRRHLAVDRTRRSAPDRGGPAGRRPGPRVVPACPSPGRAGRVPRRPSAVTGTPTSAPLAARTERQTRLPLALPLHRLELPPGDGALRPAAGRGRRPGRGDAPGRPGFDAPPMWTGQPGLARSGWPRVRSPRAHPRPRGAPVPPTHGHGSPRQRDNPGRWPPRPAPVGDVPALVCRPDGRTAPGWRPGRLRAAASATSRLTTRGGRAGRPWAPPGV